MRVLFKDNSQIILPTLLCYSKLSLVPMPSGNSIPLKVQPPKASTLSLQPGHTSLVQNTLDSDPVSNPDLPILITPKKAHFLASSGLQLKGYLLNAAF